MDVLDRFWQVIESGESLEGFTLLLDDAGDIERQMMLDMIGEAICLQEEVPAGLFNLLIQYDPECARIELGYFGLGAGSFLLHRACRYNAPGDIIELLLQLHPEALLAVENDGNNPISLLFDGVSDFNTRHIENLNLLLRHCPTLAVYTDEPPLQLALIRQTPTEILGALLDHSPEIAGITGKDGNYPLHKVCMLRSSVDMDVI